MPVPAMEPRDANILLACALLTLHEPRRSVNTHDQVASHLRIQRARVSGLLHAQDALDPRDNLMRGRVGRLIEVDDAVLQVLLQRTLG